jgi:hypothetical protein
MSITTLVLKTFGLEACRTDAASKKAQIIISNVRQREMLQTLYTIDFDLLLQYCVCNTLFQLLWLNSVEWQNYWYWWTGKNAEGSCCPLSCGTILSYVWKDWGNSRKSSISITGFQTKIQTQNLKNTKDNHSTDMLGRFQQHSVYLTTHSSSFLISNWQ